MHFNFLKVCFWCCNFLLVLHFISAFSGKILSRSAFELNIMLSAVVIFMIIILTLLEGVLHMFMHFDFLKVRFWSCNFVFHYELISFYWTQILGGMRGLNLISLAILLIITTLQEAWAHGDQPLSKIAIHKATSDLNGLAFVKVSPIVLGLKVSFYTVHLSPLSYYLAYVSMENLFDLAWWPSSFHAFYL